MIKLLITDDEITIRKGLEKVISSFGFDITITPSAANGQEALGLIAEYKPEIIIMDINIPIIDGLTVIEQSLPIIPEAKIIIISGYEDFTYAQKAVKLGAYDYLLKPIDIQQLYKTINMAIKSYLSRALEKKQLETLSLSDKIALDDPISRKVVGYLIRNYTEEELSLAQMSEELHISQSYITRIIKDKTGKSFSSYLNYMRLEKAKQLLSNESIAIGQIASACGYASLHYFTRLFKDKELIAPSQYRKNILQENENI